MHAISIMSKPISSFICDLHQRQQKANAGHRIELVNRGALKTIQLTLYSKLSSGSERPPARYLLASSEMMNALNIVKKNGDAIPYMEKGLIIQLAIQVTNSPSMH